MSVAARTMVRGACPGALRPMESGDGLIVRVRPHAGSLTVPAVLALADAAKRFGNGHIDLTRRANLQIRGVTAATLGGLQQAIDDLGLLDASPDAEAVRNIIVSPLAGIGLDEVLDVRPIASALERLIAADAGLWRLPAKFGFVIDGGGTLSLVGERADIRLAAVGRDAIAIGIDRPSGPLWLGSVTANDAPRAVAHIVRAFLATQPAGSRVRLRDAAPDAIEHVARASKAVLAPVDGVPAEFGRSQRIGVLKTGGQIVAAGVAAPFGRIEADALRGLAEVATESGVTEFRVSPWRTLYLPVTSDESGAQLLDAARKLGLATEPHDTVLKIEACPGAPACTSATLDTRAAALAIARLMPQLNGVRRVHVSGCAKGCACSEPADLVLVGGRDTFGVVRFGCADGIAESFVAPRDLDRLPALIAREGGG